MMDRDEVPLAYHVPLLASIGSAASGVLLRDHRSSSTASANRKPRVALMRFLVNRVATQRGDRPWEANRDRSEQWAI
jgi:hypothetical protein